MRTKQDLERILSRIDRKGYKSYKDIQGAYAFDTFTLHIDHVQGDPFAEPSRVRVRLQQGVAGFPPDTYLGMSRNVALRDYLTRQFSRAIGRVVPRQQRGSGKSGLIRIEVPGQEILPRSSCLVDEHYVEVRFRIGLPAAGRSILAREAREMLLRDIPEVVASSLVFGRLDRASLYRHLRTNEDQDVLRQMLR
ncbi:MAG: ATPase, partial [Deltaproteobacteria bacterium]|nr:ATPase [Deltaproteobacteria bacterium]